MSKKNKNKSFASRLTVNVLLAFSGIFLVALLVVGAWSHHLIADEATRSTENMLHAAISDMNITIANVEVASEAIAMNLAALQGQEEMFPHLACQVIARSQIIDGCMIAYQDKSHKWHLPLCITDSTGQNITMVMEESDVNFTHHDWFTQTASSLKPQWSSPHVDSSISLQSHSSYTYPVLDREGNLYAILMVTIPLSWIEDRIVEIHPYDNSRAFMRCSDSSFIGVEKDEILASQEILGDNKGFQSIAEGMSEGRDSMGRFAHRARAAFAVYGPLRNGWSLAIVCAYGDVLKRTSEMHSVMIVVGLLGLLIMFWVCRALIRKLSNPLAELSASALKMAEGDFKAHLPEISTHDEMQQLRDTFAYMQQSLDTYIEELKTTTSINERMESELNVARKIQMGMLSRDFPPKLHALLVPAKEVGGDLYDFLIKGNKLYIAVGDVSGKGVPASLMMAITRASLRFVSGLGVTMSDAVSKVNNTIAEANRLSMFVTLFVARIDLETGEMEYCNAGHNPILVIPPVGEPYFLRAIPNLAVGLFSDFPYQGELQSLRQGTRLVVYTDGVTEAENSRKELFGEDRLLKWAQKEKVRDSQTSDQEAVDDLYDTVRSFTDGNIQNDDITIMSLTL